MEYNFFFCEICNRNYIKNNNHIYSKKHRERLNFLMKRQNEKIENLSTFMKNIKIIEDDIEQPEIWCLFCKTTIKSSNSKIACKHIFLHLSYENHIDSINEFWKEQRPDKIKWKKEQFYLNKKDINEFLEKSEIVLNEINGKKEILKQIKQIMPYEKNQINIQKKNNNKINNINSIININNKIHTTDVIKNSINNNYYDNSDNNISYRTINAYGQNLTSVNINTSQITQYNIHNNNSKPIWMIESSDDESNSEDERLDIKLNIKKKNDNPVIGPPIDLYLNFKNKEKKNRLNPNRLGSTFDRNKKISKNWMPNFGSIWNTGPRSSTRKEYLNKFKNKNN